MTKKPKLSVAIIDYAMCNLFSVQHACRHVGFNSYVTSDKDDILKSDAIILPGVGAFGDAMANIRRMDLVAPIKDFIDSGRPFMGICLGMQLLMSESEEFGRHRGLNIIEGNVIRFPSTIDEGRKVKIPQVGWNRIFHPDESLDAWQKTPLQQIRDGEYMYFVHSYFAVPSNYRVVLSESAYEGIKFCSSLSFRNINAFQFHPEKSACEGIKIYKTWETIVWQSKEN